MHDLIFHSHSPEATVRFGKRFGRALKPGSVVALSGDLGSGKTTLIRGIASGLRVAKSCVKSPTFVVLHIYKGKIPVYHFDLYRLDRAADLDAIGFEEFIANSDSIALIEWAERAASVLPKERFVIQLFDTGEQSRKIRIRALGKQSKKVLQCVSTS